MNRPTRYLPDHPLAMASGKVTVSRLVLFEKLGGCGAPCHWCGAALGWMVDLCADHLDSIQRPHRERRPCGTEAAYRRGCKCVDCRGAHAERARGMRAVVA